MLGRFDVLAKHILRAVRRKADEVKIGDPRPFIVELAEQLVE